MKAFILFAIAITILLSIKLISSIDLEDKCIVGKQHEWSKWKTTGELDQYSRETQNSECSVCGTIRKRKASYR